jgi:methylglutamate dehydrogenase subunit C
MDAGLMPYGIEALDVLRVEKGYLTSAEINGQTTPLDLNMQGLLNLDNPCIGRELLNRPAFHESTRHRLVGIMAADGRSKVLAGAQITAKHATNLPCGHVTSSVYSPALANWVGLALIDGSLAQNGSVLLARDPLRIGDTPIRVTPVTHYDPDGERLRS